MMMQISSDVESMQSADEPSLLALSETSVESPQTTSPFPGPPQNDNDVNMATSALITDERRVPSLSLSDVNPPEVQKVVVEHIVKREDTGSFLSSPIRLRSFSGKIPRPNSEADYDTWRSHIELLLNYPSMSPLQVSRRILESLLSPAADVVKSLCSNSLPSAYLQLLDSAFGAVEDGEELFAQLMNTLQDPGEKPSTYLQQLQLALNQAVKTGGVAPGEVGKHLLKQFCRGCWDIVLLSSLQLEQKKSFPPSFTELLLMLRTKEDRQAAKASRMRKHVGSIKQRVQLQSQSSFIFEPTENPETNPSAIDDLRKQVASLQSQLTTLMAQKKYKGFSDRGATGRTQDRVLASQSAKPDMSKQPRKNYTNEPRPCYCFNCGEDGHIATICTNDSNPTVVTEKRRQLEERQHV
ncbi:paraneoplastic antigen Ma3 homolog [Neoarius graeffei]|uniref:paraneoplastic antigen Ma3 homolog n=1 Tax=Neoarius graeffei TaxID=443677 RepID=UPI00298C6C0A|nr:paraneoplastic antigen Ma3 homolog [Neoarius graeffei]